MDQQLASLLAEAEKDPISNLNEQLPISPAVSMEEFVDQCGGLIAGMDPRRHLLPEVRSILLPKTKISVTPFQLLEGWKMLNQRERTGLRGGLQASSTGVGKSYMILVSVLLRALLFENARIVKEFWSKPATTRSSRARPAPAQHLASSARGEGLRCPSQKNGDVICYCVPHSKTRSFVDGGLHPTGATLIQAPFPIVVQWIQIFENAVLDPAAFNLVIVYPDVPLRLRRDFRRVTDSLVPGARGSQYAPETYIFCSSHTNPKIFETFTSPGIELGLHFVDESHRAMKMETHPLAIAEAQSRSGYGIDLWLVSATPIRSLEDFELPVRIFCNSTDLARAASVTKMVAAHKTARSSAENMETFLKQWSRVFDNKLVLRNTVTSEFNGRPITGLQRTKPDIIWFQTPQQDFDHVQKVAYVARGVIRERERIVKINREVFALDYASGIDARLHFVSLFPGSASLILTKELDVDEGNITKTIDAMKVSNKLKVETIEKFQQHLERITRGSPKLDFIVDEIGRMRADKSEREPDPKPQATLHKEDLSIKKMVIITPTLGTAVFLYLFLMKRMPELNPVILHSSARTGDREAALNSFQSLTARKNAKHSYILITSFSSGGTGLNLQSANYQIFTSPPSSREMETQGFARTNRTGQRLALHHSTLIMRDNPADKINVVSYGGRKIRNDPFEMKRSLVLVEPDGSKKIQRLSEWGYQVTEFDFMFDVISDVYENLIEEHQCHALRITHPAAANDYLDKLVYFDSETTAGKDLGVSEAWNEKGDPRPRHERLALRDLLLGLWVYDIGRPARELKSITYFTVIETHLTRLRSVVYELMEMKKMLTENLVILGNNQSPEEQEAFNTLLENAPFCIGVQKMLSEYPEFAGVQIQSFEFIPDIDDEDWPEPFPSYNFRISFE